MQNTIPSLPSYIAVLKGFAPSSFCSDIVESYRESDRWSWAKVGSGDGLEDFKARKVKLIRLSAEQEPEYDKKVFDIVSSAVLRYKETLESKGHGVPDIRSDEGYQLLNYQEGYYFNEHVDEGGGLSRTLTCVINLTDQHDGGNFCFFKEQIKVKLGVGDVVIFPSSFLFPHSVSTITKGERYSIVTWLK